jgi:outer membrane protein assembly factor BamB
MSFPLQLRLLAMLVLCGSALAIHKDQAGKYDWLKQHVGVIEHVQVGADPQALIYVASTTNVLAALRPADGSLLWRKVFDEKDAINAMEIASGVLVTLSSDSRIRAFGGDQGHLLWEVALPGGPGIGERAAIAVVPGGSGALVVAARSGAVQAYALDSGRKAWSTDVADAPQAGAAVHAGTAPGEVLVAFAAVG